MNQQTKRVVQRTCPQAAGSIKNARIAASGIESNFSPMKHGPTQAGSRSQGLCGPAIRARAFQASIQSPAPTSAAPAMRDKALPGTIFSASTRIASSAIHIRFITPSTNSNVIRAQQQPTQ